MQLPQKLCIAGGSLFVMGITFGWMAFPKLVRSGVRKKVTLKEGSELRDMWIKYPYTIDFNIYLFNVTNPDEIKDGQKPIVQEIGPFAYDEIREKVDLVDREEDDSVEYSMKTTWYFNPARSNGLTGEEEVTLPHMVILGMVLTALREKPGAVGVLAKAVDSIFKKPPSLFMKFKAKDILFEGVPVDCRVSDFAGSAVCALLKEESKDLVELEENYFKFSVFGPKNATVLKERVRVLRGIKNSKDVGRVIEFDEKPMLEMWAGDYCNTLNGTDGTVFPPLMTEEDDVVSFASDICRSLSARFVKHTVTQGVKTFRYTADFGDMSSDPDLQCFCPTPDTCLSKQLYDVTKCVGAPIIASLPHLYMADEWQERVGGLNPTQSLHEINMDFEPMTATPIRASKRIQFNMHLQPVPKFKLMKNFPEALLPILWLEESFSLHPTLVKKVKMAFKMIAIVGVMKWLMVIGGIGLGGAGAGLHFKNRGSSKKLEITKVTPQSGSRKDSGQEKKWPPTMNISTIQNSVPATLDRN